MDQKVIARPICGEDCENQYRFFLPVADDGTGRLTLVNQAARRYLGEDPQEDLRGCHLTDICPCREMEEVLAVRERVLDREVSVADRTMIVNVLPLRSGDAVTGAVASFRPKDELDQLSRKLLHMQEYSELLRAKPMSTPTSCTPLPD